jgi:8-oxo-dGTP pyrophosphatase MutT (NUDIX family)
VIEEIVDVHVRRGEGGWPFPAGDRQRIAEHWERLVASNPRLWNGRVLGTLAPGRSGGISIRDGVLTATALEDDFAAFVAWRDWGFPDLGLRNLFGSAVIRAADGPLIYGLMGAHTANPGRIYPPGGSLEPRDVTADGRVDVLRSIELELAEETGLSHGDAAPERLLAVFDGPRVSIAQVYRFSEPADVLAGRIRAFIAADSRPELADIVVVSRAADLPAKATQPFAAALATHLLG